jgi:hypothetical protein
MDWGSFAGGVSSGLESGSQINQRNAGTAMSKEQLAQIIAQNAGAQAYIKSLYPGSMAVPPNVQPSAQGIDNQSMPAMSQMPVIGPAIQGLQNLFGGGSQPPQGGGNMPMRNPMFSGGIDGGGGMPQGSPPMGAIQPPQQPQPGMAMPTGQVQGGQPIERAQAQPAPPQPQGMPVTPQALAIAIDRANPGLRQSNPRAFAQAVQIGMQQMAQMQGQQSEIAFKQAQAQELGARGEMETAHGQYYGDRARVAAQGNKALTTMYTQNEAAIRHLEAQKTKLRTAFDLKPAEKKMYVAETDRQLQGYYARRDELVKQMRGESSTSAPAPQGEDKSPVTPLKISDSNLARLKKMPPAQLQQLFENMEKKGASKEALAQLARMLKEQE